MSDSVVNLSDGTPVDPTGLLLGAWREIGVRRVPPGGSELLAADGVEHTVYVMRGGGTARTGGDEVPAAAGTAVTILKGDAVEFETGEEPMELFVCTFDA